MQTKANMINNVQLADVDRSWGHAVPQGYLYVQGLSVLALLAAHSRLRVHNAGTQAS
jgi:hypothetical protein